MIKKILIHLGVYQGKRNQRAPPTVLPDYTERVKIVPYDDGWLEYEEAVFESQKSLKLLMGRYVQNWREKGREVGFLI